MRAFVLVLLLSVTFVPVACSTNARDDLSDLDPARNPGLYLPAKPAVPSHVGEQASYPGPPSAPSVAVLKGARVSMDRNYYDKYRTRFFDPRASRTVREYNLTLPWYDPYGSGPETLAHDRFAGAGRRRGSRVPRYPLWYTNPR